MGRKKKRELWSGAPQNHDYPAAEDFLSLLYSPTRAKALVAKLRKQPIVTRKAKDLLRASRLPILDASNAHVRGDLKKIENGETLSPVLLIRGDADVDAPLQIADGYHRICASWHVDEDADIPCQIADAGKDA